MVKELRNDCARELLLSWNDQGGGMLYTLERMNMRRAYSPWYAVVLTGN